MDFEYIEYKGITFPVRDCEFTDGKSTIRRRIGSEVMSDFLFSGEGGIYLDEEYKEILEEAGVNPAGGNYEFDINETFAARFVKDGVLDGDSYIPEDTLLEKLVQK